MKKVLVNIDLSEYSQESIDKAISTIEDTKEFVFVSIIPDTYSHFWDYPNLNSEGKSVETNTKRLRPLYSSIKIPGIANTDIEIIQGNPLDTLLKFSEEHVIDIIILKYPTGSSFKELVARRLARKLITKSKVPVMLIK
ncbi:MAG: universal stress protein [Thermoplasmata archaeon]